MPILSLPGAYILSQRAVGADRARAEAIEALAIAPGHRVLDVGCGPAYYFESLPRVEYWGFDTDVGYIAWARRRFGASGAHFHAEPYTEERRRELPPVDRVMLMGLLHHLDDAASGALLDLVARSLAPGGRVATLDTVLFPGQSAFSRLLAKNDRGDFVRYPGGFLALAHRRFVRVEDRLIGDTFRMPAAMLLMTLAEPR